MRRCVACLLTMTLLGVSFLCPALAAPQTLESSEPILVLVQQPIFFDVAAKEIDIAVLVACFEDETPIVTKTKAVFAGQTHVKEGTWRPASLRAYYTSRSDFLDDWTAYQAPGVKSGDRERKSQRMEAALAALLDAGAQFEILHHHVEGPSAPHPGETYPILVETTLNDGRVLKVTGLAIATSYSAPAGWVLGDCHTHTTFSDGGYTPAQIKTAALQLGHHFTIVTDHIDMVRSKADPLHTQTGWDLYRHVLLDENSLLSGYTQIPCFEVTAKNFINGEDVISGDLLGIGYWATDPVAIINQYYSGPYLINLIQGADPTDGSNLACVAHPGGNPAWLEGTGCGYHGVQVDSAEAEKFWHDSMPLTTCHPVAIGGSDAHYTYGLPIATMTGEATWVLASSFNSFTQYANKISYLTSQITYGNAAATSQGSLAFYKVGTSMPATPVTLPAGSTQLLTLNLYPIKNGYSVAVSWAISNGGSIITGSKQLAANTPGTATAYVPVLAGTKAWHTVFTFKYYDSSGT